MSWASRSKNIPLKPSGNSNGGSGAMINGYNPVLGKFHTVDTSVWSSAPSLHMNSRSSSIDETHDSCAVSVGSGKEYDTVSNNSSWSADSEDHKEKPRHNSLPLQADKEKREKIRLKNEKKHQRQKERRAQELHDRCTGFLMSRKLEALSQQLVAMGFSSERATMALMMNHGKIEESISWLIKGGEGANKQKERNAHAGNLKVDIYEELARIADMETQYKCSKQEVERAIVACEGDLRKAEEILSSSQSLSKTQLKPIVPSVNDKKGGEKSSNISSGVHVEFKREHQQETRKSLPKLTLPASLQRTSPQAKSEAQNLVLEQEFYSQQLGKQDQVVLMHRPQNENPNWSPFSGNISHNASMRQLYNGDQHHRQVGGLNNGTGDRRGNSPTISVASSLGLYSGSGSSSCSSRLSSPVDWNSMGSLLLQFDYTNVDWSLNPSPSTADTWQGIASGRNNGKRRYDPFPSAVTSRSRGFGEWSSAFEERDIFSLPWQFVSPPSL